MIYKSKEAVMKKLLFLVLLLISFCFSAEVKPFVFENVINDSAAQQVEFDYMLKYKLFGRDYLKMGRRVIIPDKSGWNGTVNDITSAEQIKLGGPVLAGGSISLGNGCQLLTGPIIADSFKSGGDNGEAAFSGAICLKDTVVSDESKKGITRGNGELTTICPAEYTLPTSLSIPTVPTWGEATHEDVIINANGGEEASKYFIDVPDGDSKEIYDIYINTIDLNKTGSKDGAKLYVRMPEGGRLTRIFVHNLLIGNHTTIQVVYRTYEGDVYRTQKEYTGNLMFYSDNDIVFYNTDNVPIQGTYISYKKIDLKCNLDFSGQLLANQLEVGDDFKGENFIFTPFDKKIIDIDPELNKNGGLIENDSTVTIPIKLSDTATVDVYFTYCFELNSNVVKTDFNTEGLDFPVCVESTKEVVIPVGKMWPSDTIKVNVKRDDLVEPNDTLVVKIKIESGAVLPGDKTEGVLKIKITDADYKNTAPVIDTTAKFNPYLENQLIPPSTGLVGKVKVTDDDATKLRYSLTGSDLFYIDSLTGEVFTNHVFDYETEDTTYTVNIKVTDGEFADSADFIINIGNLDEGITAIADIKPVYEGPADSIVGGIVGTVIGKDADSTKVSYVLTDSTKTFKIDSNGVITIAKALDYETKNEYPVKVSMTSTDGSKKDTTFTIKVLNVNEPCSVKDTTFTIKENETGKIGKVDAKDPDTDKAFGTITYTISDTTKYSIDKDGNVSVKVPFNYEETSADEIKVFITDGLNKDTAVIKIEVKDVNEAPTVEDLNASVDENKIGVIDTLVASDPDKGDKLTYKVIDNASISVDSNGVVSVIKPFDYESDSVIVAHIVVTDKHGVADTATIKVSINDVNEKHTVKDEKLVVPEDKLVPSPIDTVKVTDPDKTNDIKFELIDSTNTFKVDSNGVITLVKPLDYETQKEYEILVIAKDDDFADTAKIKISVGDVDESSKLTITHVDTKDTTYTDKFDTIYTNSPSVDVWYELCLLKPGCGNMDSTILSDFKEGENKREICDIAEGSDKKSCSTIIVNYSSKTPIITVATVDKNDGKINGVTIVDEPDGFQYVNDTIPEIKITVKDPADSTKNITFKTKIELSPIDVSSKELKNMNIEPLPYADPTAVVMNTLVPNKKDSVITALIEKGARQEVKQTVEQIIDGKKVEVTMTYYTDSTGAWIESIPYEVEYTKKVNGRDITISYTTTSSVDVVKNYEVSYKQLSDNGDTVSVKYPVDTNGKVIANKEGNVGYTISYSYTNQYGNTGVADLFVYLDVKKPEVKILTPTYMEKYTTNSLEVVWTVDGIAQDTLNIERLEKGANFIVRCYMDKATNNACDTVAVFMENAKDIDVALVNPVTEISKEKVDEYYSDSKNKYNPNKPYTVAPVAPEKYGEKIDVIGPAVKIDIALPHISPTGGLATLDDMIHPGINGSEPGILVDEHGNLKSGTSTGADGSYTIPVDKYMNDYCTDDFKKDYMKYGADKASLWDVKLNLHLWIYDNTSHYVNDFVVKYNLDTKNSKMVNEAGMLKLVLDMIPDTDGYVKSKNHKAIGTGAYLTKLEVTSINTLKCSLPGQDKGSKVKKSEYELVTFGYKRPVTNK